MPHKKFLYTMIFFFPTILSAREFRTPLYKPAQHSFFYMPQQLDASQKINTQIYAHYFRSKAKKAFTKESFNGTKKNNIATLFFGKPNFEAQEAFANSTAFDRLNPFLNTTLTPKFSYTDQGVMLSTICTTQPDTNWQIGARVHLPIRSFKMKKEKAKPDRSGELGGQTAADVFLFATQQNNGVTFETFAFRLDALTALPMVCTADGLQVSLVTFHDEEFPTAPRITIRGKDMTEDQVLLTNQNPATVIKNIAQPTMPFAINCPTAQALPILSPDGLSANLVLLQNNDRARFSITQNYIPLGESIENQSMLWIVPTFDENQLVNNALKIKTVVRELLGCINQSAEDTFASSGINFSDQTETGFSDIQTDLFARYFFSDCWSVDSYLALTIPIGKTKDAKKILFQPLGNNRHTEIAIGIASHVQHFDWMTQYYNLNYNFVLSGHEDIPATFSGAQVKGLGPLTPARISWRYVLGTFAQNFTLFSHHCHNVIIGWNYEFYHKQTDRITFKKQKIIDALGILQPLDVSLTQKNTDQTAHTIRFNTNYSYDHNNCSIQFFGGGQWTVGGKNVPRQHGWYIGSNILF